MNRAGDGYPAFQKNMGLNCECTPNANWFGVRCFKNKKLDVACWLFNRWTYCCLRFENLKR